MYYKHFGLSENPFRPTPDPRYLYLSRGHQEALDHLIYGIGERKGFIMVTGGVGTGKTTLLRALLEDLDADVKTALVLNPFVSEEDLLPTICEEFGVAAPEGGSKRSWLDALNRFLLENHAAGKTAVLLLDEAQNLSRDVLEEVRILSNLETETDKLLQIVLVGQEELISLLTLPEMRQLNERIVVRYHLGPLEKEDITAYIQHRMTVAGCKKKLPFTAGALKAVVRASGGIPRKINAICDRALLAAYTAGSARVAPNMVAEAAAEVTGAPRERRTRSWNPWPVLFGVTLAALFIYVAVDLLIVKDRAPAPSRTTEATAAVTPVQPAAPAPEPSAAAPVAVEEPPAEPEPEVIEVGVVEAAKPVAPPPRPAPWRLPYAEALALVMGDSGEAVPSGAVLGLPVTLSTLRSMRGPFLAEVDCGENDGVCFAVVLDSDERGFRVRAADQTMRALTFAEMADAWKGRAVWVVPENVAALRVMPGMRGADVLWVQQTLSVLGYPAKADGVFGPETLGMVKRFQEDHGLPGNGNVGYRTAGLLYPLGLAKNSLIVPPGGETAAE